MKKVINGIALVLVLFVFTGCDANDGDIYLGVSGIGTYNLEVSGVNLTGYLGVYTNSTGEYDKVDPGEITYTYEYMTGNADDPDTDDDESWGEETGSFTLTANAGSFPDDGLDKQCLMTLLSLGMGAAVMDLTCADITE